MEEDPDKINDPNRQLETKVVAKAKDYQESRLRSRDENAVKAKGRKEIADLGFRTDAYQHSLRVSRDLTPKEQKDYVRDFRFFLKVFSDNQADLWPEDAAKAAARAQKRAARAAKAKESATAQEQRVAADSPRSDPKRGGAGGAKGRGKAKDVAAKKPRGNLRVVSEAGVTTEDVPLVEETGDELIARVARERQAEQELRDGGQILDTAIDSIKSQSQIAQEKRDEAFGGDA